MSTGQIVYVSTDLTGLQEPLIAKIIKIRNNPFIGREIAAKDDQGRIFFGPENCFMMA